MHAKRTPKLIVSLFLVAALCVGMVIPVVAAPQTSGLSSNCDHSYKWEYETNQTSSSCGIIESAIVTATCEKCGGTIKFDSTNEEDGITITPTVKQATEYITTGTSRGEAQGSEIEYSFDINAYVSALGENVTGNFTDTIKNQVDTYDHDYGDIEIYASDWDNSYITNPENIEIYAYRECSSGDAFDIAQGYNISLSGYYAPSDGSDGKCDITFTVYIDGKEQQQNYTYSIPASNVSTGDAYTATITSWDKGDETDINDDTFTGELISVSTGTFLTFTKGENSNGVIAAAVTNDKINCTQESSIQFSVTVEYNGEKYDADMGEYGSYTVSPTGHIFELNSDGYPINGEWSWGFSDPEDPTCSASYTCQHCGDNIDVSISSIQRTGSDDSTCDTDGHIYYMAMGTLSNGISTTYPVTGNGTAVLTAKGHNYSYDKEDTKWSDNYDACRIAIECSRCDDVQYIEDTTITEVTEDPTCEKAGYTEYTATGEFDGKSYSAVTSIPLDAIGHNWDYDNAEVEYDYSNGTAIVSVTCLNCGETRDIHAEIEYEVQYIYNEETDEYEVSNVVASVKITGIDDSSMTYTFWTQDDAEETFSNHNWVRDALGSVPTCTVDGYAVYSCSDEGCSATMTETEKAYGHDWNMSLYSVANPNGVTHEWHSNYQTCTFNFVCNRCGADISVESTVTSSTSNGITTYSASCMFNGKTFQTSVTVNALGQTIDGDLGTTTIGGSNSGSANDTNTTSGMLGDTTVGESNKTTAKAQTAVDTAETSGVIVEETTNTSQDATGTAQTVEGTTTDNTTTETTTTTSTSPTTATKTATTAVAQTAQTGETGNVKTSDIDIALICAIVIGAGSISAVVIKSARKDRKEES